MKLREMDLTQVFVGMGLALGLHALALLLMLLSFFVLPGKTPLLFFMGIGLFQIVYQLPLWLWLHRRGQRERRLGVQMIGLLTIGLNILFYAALKYQ